VDVEVYDCLQCSANMNNLNNPNNPVKPLRKLKIVPTMDLVAVGGTNCN